MKHIPLTHVIIPIEIQQQKGQKIRNITRIIQKLIQPIPIRLQVNNCGKIHKLDKCFGHVFRIPLGGLGDLMGILLSKGGLLGYLCEVSRVSECFSHHLRVSGIVSQIRGALAGH